MATTTVPQQFSETCAFALDAYASQICDAAGVPFMGIQHGYKDFESVVLFNEPNGSTLAVPLASLSTETIRTRLAAHAKENQ